MKQREFRIGPGAASLLLVAVVVSMSVLGLLAMINARGDYRLTERTAAYAVSEYRAAEIAQYRLADLDAVLSVCAAESANDETYLRAVASALPEGMKMDGWKVSWEQQTQEGRILHCEVELFPLGSAERFVWREHAYRMDNEMF